MMKKIIPVFLLLAFIFSCKSNPKNDDSVNSAAEPQSFAGNYVTSDYHIRNKGYDWVAVKIIELSDSMLQISIRARADLKKPTCTFDAIAYKIEPGNVFNSTVEGFGVYFTFEADTLVISGETDQDNEMLGYFCSGGASLAGVYCKTAEQLDTAQIDKALFRKSLSYGEYFFLVEVFGDKLTIQLTGLEKDNTLVEHQVVGAVVNAEVGDLNTDGFPEVLVYLQSYCSGSYGSVIGYSVNNGRSMSSINMPGIANYKEAGNGYMGHDEFAIVENMFNQRFPVYNTGDSNASPTGGMRQIQYKLVDGETMRQLVVDKIVEY